MPVSDASCLASTPRGRRLYRCWRHYEQHARWGHVLLLLLSFSAWGQPVSQTAGFSLQFEAGAAYQEIFSQPQALDNSESSYIPALKAGIRARYAFSPQVGAYAASFLRQGLLLEAGVFFPLLPNASDPFGWHTSLGAGLSYQVGEEENRFGLAFHAQVHYNFSERAYLGLRYSHRPIITPRWAQDFDVGLVFGLYLYE